MTTPTWIDRPPLWLLLAVLGLASVALGALARPKVGTDTLALLIGLSFLVVGVLLWLVAIMLTQRKSAVPAVSDPIRSACSS